MRPELVKQGGEARHWLGLGLGSGSARVRFRLTLARVVTLALTLILTVGQQRLEILAAVVAVEEHRVDVP